MQTVETVLRLSQQVAMMVLSLTGDLVSRHTQGTSCYTDGKHAKDLPYSAISAQVPRTPMTYPEVAVTQDEAAGTAPERKLHSWLL